SSSQFLDHLPVIQCTGILTFYPVESRSMLRYYPSIQPTTWPASFTALAPLIVSAGRVPRSRNGGSGGSADERGTAVSRAPMKNIRVRARTRTTPDFPCRASGPLRPAPRFSAATGRAVSCWSQAEASFDEAILQLPPVP